MGPPRAALACPTFWSGHMHTSGGRVCELGDGAEPISHTSSLVSCRHATMLSISVTQYALCGRRHAGGCCRPGDGVAHIPCCMVSVINMHCLCRGVRRVRRVCGVLPRPSTTSLPTTTYQPVSRWGREWVMLREWLGGPMPWWEWAVRAVMDEGMHKLYGGKGTSGLSMVKDSCPSDIDVMC